MKSAAINSAAGLFATHPGTQTNEGKKGAKVDFSTFMSQASLQNGQDVCGQLTSSAKDSKASFADKKPSAKWDDALKDEMKTQEDVSDETKKAESDVSVSDWDDLAEEKGIPEEIAEKVEEIISKIKDALKSGFDLSEEELVSALENLGFTLGDFMNPESLNACIQALSGAEDSMALLVDEQLYNTCTQLQKEVVALVGELNENVSLTEDEMEMVLAKLDEMQQTDGLQSVAAMATDGETVVTGKQAETAVETNPDNSVFVDSKEETNRVQVGTERNTENREDAKTVVDSETETFSSVPKNSENTRKESDFTGENLAQGQNTVAEESLHQTGAAPQSDTGNVFSSTIYDGSYESIIRQVAEQVRVHVTEQASVMEMQLNPESLGKLGLSVELKQGMVTAKFVAENEQVKEAIENQVAVLKEDLNRTGMKVEAIEVTVETHEFERNLEEGQQQNQAEEEAEAERQQNSRRNINLDLLEEEDELTEAEDLAAKIMKENGNSMDYFV